MSLLKRAILYIFRKWKKSLLIFLILFSVSTLVLLGTAFSKAEKEETAELRGTTGVSFSVSRNTAVGGWGSDSSGSYSTQEYVSREMMEKIASVDGIKGYNSSIRTILSLSNMKGEWLEQLQPTGHAIVDCQFYSYGCINSEYDSLFLSGALRMSEGKSIDSSVINGIIISREIADKHGLKVGDSIQAVNNPMSNDKTLKLKIIGLFEVVVDKTDERNNYNESSYYDYSNYSFVNEAAMRDLLENYSDVGYASADFFVTDPEQLETIIQEVKKIDSINWDNFIITANDEVYERIASSVSDTGKLISTFVIVISVVGTAIIILLQSMWVRGRKHEIGILLAIGLSKPVIVLQYIFEMLTIALVAFPISYLVSKNADVWLKLVLGKMEENIVVTSHSFIFTVIVGIMLLVFSTILACIPLMCYKPKEILSQME